MGEIATGRRPLRQWYEGSLPLDVDEALGGVEPWRRHRARFLADLTALADDDWAGATRCDEWDVKDVISHLVTVDGFWTVSLAGALDGSPTLWIRDFDPIGMPEALVDPMRELPPAAILERFAEAAGGLGAAVDAIDAAGSWESLGEAPIGHAPARVVLGHAMWDSWVHERDIALPAGRPFVVEDDELLMVAWYALAFGGLQGGLLGDEAPAGPGATAPIDVVLAFDDLPSHPIHVRVDERVSLSLATDATDAFAAGSAVALVDALTGRAEDGWSVPDDLAAHLARARTTL